jgi:hypothetical protein
MKGVRLLMVGALLVAVPACGQRRKNAPPDPVYEGKPLSKWTADLKAAEVAERRAAAKALAKMGKQGLDTRPGIMPLQEALKDKDGPTRYWSAVGLVYAVRQTPMPLGNLAGPVLREAAREGDDQVRAEAEEVLKQVGSAGGPGKAPGKGGPAGPPGGAGATTGRGQAPPTGRGPASEVRPAPGQDPRQAPGKD